MGGNRFRVGWLIAMAWRDTRSGRARLVLFASAIAIGVASIVLIDSFSRNLQTTVNEQAKSLVGADLVFQNRRPFDATFETLIAGAHPVARAQETVFSSMIVFANTGRTRLVQVRGLEG